MSYSIRKARLFSALVVLLLSAKPLIANIVAYNFTGVVVVASGQPWNLSIPAASHVTGQLEYDSSTAASSSTTDSAFYTQSIPDGLTATFGSIPISASDYSVHVFNDLPQKIGTADVITVEWSSADNPVPATMLNANGITESNGIFSVSLVYGTNTFPDTSLPTSLPVSGFSSTLTNFVSHVPTGLFDVIYTVSSLTAVPEPPSWALSITALTLVGIGYQLKRRNEFRLHLQ